MTGIQTMLPVSSGTIMVQEGLLLPEHMGAATVPYSAGWRTASADGFAFDHKLRLLGWACFFLAGELKTVSFGSSQAGMLKSAVRRLLSKVRLLDFNCVEFTGVVNSRFLGIPYVSVRGHARHVQDSSQLDSAEERNRQQKETTWARN
jgi:hypothetical protein